MAKLTKIGIADVSIALPADEVTSEEMAEAHGIDLGFLTEKIGIKSRRRLNPSESVTGLAKEAIEALLENTDYSPDQIQLLMFVTQTPDYAIPHNSALVQASVGISNRCLVFDLSLGCSGYVIGIAIANALMTSLGFSVGVVVTGEAYSRIVDPSDRATGALFGDAATATLLTKNGEWKILDSVFSSHGDKAETLIYRGSGSIPGPREPLHMDGREILNFTREKIPELVSECLSLNRLSNEEIDHFLFHQANGYVLDTLRDRLGLSNEKVLRSFSDVGNTTSSSIPIVLKREVLEKKLESKVIVMCGFGVGLSAACLVLTRDNQ